MAVIPFTKVEAIGNHFVLIDALQSPEMDWSALALQMCAHHSGVGADGLLALLPSDEADFRLRMFNPDGTEDACGNGLRCIAAYVHATGLFPGNELLIQAKNGIRRAEILDSDAAFARVRVNMGRPSLRPADIPAVLDCEEITDHPLDVLGDTYLITGVSVGTPHAVICAPWELFWSTIPSASRDIEIHPAFPERISVTWCSPESEDSLRIRTWERGVGPTLGCGTASCAALVAANLRGTAGTRANVTSPGGTLEIEWADRDELLMSGPANIVYRGKFGEPFMVDG